MLGIFDSGVGGLSVLKVLKEKLPQIDVVYFGDIKNAPYGTKTQDELKELTINGFKILLKNGATNILSACNSVSPFIILDEIKGLSDSPFDVIGMIKPTVKEFKKYDNLAIFATPATIESEAYQNSFKKVEKEIKTFAIPELAGAIEFGKSEKEIENIIDRAVSMATQSIAIETTLLCCTHYPFHKEKFEKAFAKHNKKVSVYDPAEAVIKSTIKKFNLQPSSNSKSKGKIKFLISQDSPVFKQKVNDLFNKFEYSIKIL